MDVKYLVKYDYESRYAEDHEESCSDGICRCKIIENVEVSGFDTGLVFEDLSNLAHKWMMQEEDLTPINMYCLYRFLRHQKFEFEPIIENGYYGEELESIELSKESTAKLIDFCSVLAEMKDDTEKIKNSLLMEYGYMLPKIENKQVEIQQVKFSEINIPNKEYMGELVSKREKLYRFYDLKNFKDKLPQLLCVKSYNKIKLVDGYNRAAGIVDFFAKQKIEKETFNPNKLKVSILVFA